VSASNGAVVDFGRTLTIRSSRIRMISNTDHTIRRERMAWLDALEREPLRLGDSLPAT
jgi:hypothetical protein